MQALNTVATLNEKYIPENIWRLYFNLLRKYDVTLRNWKEVEFTPEVENHEARKKKFYASMRSIRNYERKMLGKEYMRDGAHYMKKILASGHQNLNILDLAGADMPTMLDQPSGADTPSEVQENS